MVHIGSSVTAPNESPAPAVVELVILALGPAALALFLWRRLDRLDKAPSVPPISPLGGGVVFFGMFVAGALGSIVASRLLPEAATGDEPEPLWILAVRHGSVLGAQAIFVVVVSPIWRAKSAGGDGSRRPGVLPAALLGLGALAIFWPMVNFTVQTAGFVIERFGGPPADRVGHETLRRLLESPQDIWFWVIAGLVVIPGPILEEIVYRGVLQRGVQAIVQHRWVAIGITSLIFATMHFDVAQPQAVAGIFVLSLGFGWVYERTGRLVASATMHIVFNAANVALTMA